MAPQALVVQQAPVVVVVVVVVVVAVDRQDQVAVVEQVDYYN